MSRPWPRLRQLKASDNNSAHGHDCRHRPGHRNRRRFSVGFTQRLVNYLSLHPSVQQSEPGPAQHGRIAAQTRGHIHGMLVEVARVAVRAPGPLLAYFLRLLARRGQHIAGAATALKSAVLVRHPLRKQAKSAYAWPALHARNLHDLELNAGNDRRPEQRGTALAYKLASDRDHGPHVGSCSRKPTCYVGSCSGQFITDKRLRRIVKHYVTKTLRGSTFPASQPSLPTLNAFHSSRQEGP